jgi:MFS transporter, DHA2 family, multidrug resistance protein
MSITFLLPLFMQQLLGFSAIQAGTALMPRALAMMVAIPLAGRLYNYVQPRILVIAGVVLVALSAYEMSHYTLDTGSHSVVAAIILQGFGFACIFVPLTTVALASIPRYRMTDATGLNSLLRQIGGSLGLAAFATLLPHFVQTARVGLVSHLVAGRPEVMQRLGGIQTGLVARGLDPGAARETAGRVLDGMLSRQAMLLAFERLFILAGVAFLFVVPLALFLKPPPGSRSKPVDLH